MARPKSNLKRVSSYQTADGHKFDNAKDARAHEATLSLDTFLGNWFHDHISLNKQQVRDHMVAAGDDLVRALNSISKRAKAASAAAEKAEPEAAAAD